MYKLVHRPLIKGPRQLAANLEKLIQRKCCFQAIGTTQFEELHRYKAATYLNLPTLKHQNFKPWETNFTLMHIISPHVSIK